MPPQELYILSFSSPLYPAHWALWIPHTTLTFGREIQVQGDAHTGFIHEFKSNCDLTKSSRKHTLTLIGEISSKYVKDVDEDEEEKTYVEATDRLEEVALSVPPPKKTLNSVGDGVKVEGPPKKVKILNCQDWIHDYVGKLVEVGIINKEAIETLKDVPRN